MLDVTAVDGIRTLGNEASAVFEGLDGGGVLIHEIDLLEGKTLGLEGKVRTMNIII